MDIINALGAKLEDILRWVINLLPDSPFMALNSSPIQPYLQALNWIVPIDFMISTMSAWLVAIVVYYVYSVILRWVKAIS